MSDSKDSSQEQISQKSSPAAENKNNKNRAVIGTCAVVAVASLGVALFLLLNKDKPEKRDVLVTEDNMQTVIADMEKAGSTAPGHYTVTMNTDWEFENGSSASSNSYVENSTVNNNDVYFDVVRSDTGETIYKSPIIPVGSRLANITLDEKLDAGSYACVLTYSLLDESQQPTQGTLSLNLNIVVKN